MTYHHSCGYHGVRWEPIRHTKCPRSRIDDRQSRRVPRSRRRDSLDPDPILERYMDSRTSCLLEPLSVIEAYVEWRTDCVHGTSSRGYNRYTPVWDVETCSWASP